MIDITQWRMSIGLNGFWNYCQASSGRPSNRCSLGGDCTAGSTNRKKKGRRSLVLSFIVFLVSISILLSGYLNYEPHVKGVVIHCYWSKVQCASTGHTITDSSYLQSILLGSDISSSDVFYSSVYLINLLLLSGDVELNPGPLTGNPKDIFRTHSDKLIHAISENLHNVTLALNAKGLITQQIKEDMLVLGASNYEKSSKLVNVIQEILEASLKSHQYLTELCQVLQNQQNHALRNIAASILGQTIPDDVLSYAHSMKQCYKAEDWMQALKDYSGRLTLVEKQDYTKEAESAGYLLMGQVDKVVKLSGNKEISVEDILRPVDDSLPLRVVINGPPGIGKTVLCHKLIKMWCETLVNQQYDLVLYCPLRNSKLATLADLFQDGTSKVQTVDWFSDRAGERLLIIFDGWDELSEQLRQSSLVASIIYKGLLRQCSVIVTSRSYASSSLLKINNLSRHVQVIGFSKVEISKVIIQTLQKDTTLAQEPVDKKREDDKEGRHFTTEQTSKDSQLAVNLIKDLSVQDDVQSLCYVPLLCSMVISVYSEEGGHLPTQLYEKFILQIIKRHVKSRHAPHTLGTGSLSSLPSHLDMPLQEMCQIAYTNLANTTMTFSSHQLQSLSEAVNEDYLGLMTSFIAHDEEKYQFLHLRIQEFLAAWWIAKHEEKTEEIAKNHFHDDHFRKCLSFVSEITGTFYFSEEIFKRTLNEADSLQYSVSTAIVQGEAGVGKTCLKSLILSLSYKEVSTSCIEAPCIAYISRYGSNDGKLWDFVTDDEIDENVIAQLQDSMIRAGQASNETDESFTSVDTKCSHYSVPDYHHSGHHQKVTKKQNLIIKPDVDSPIEENVDLHLSEPKMPIESETREDNDETLITAAVSRDVSYNILASGKKFNPLEYCRNSCNIKKIGLHRQWLYFFDSGGQIQFQKLLLAFMPCPSVLILVINLSKKLSEPSNREMKLPGNKKILVDITSLKIQDILAQMVSAVASKAQQHKLTKTDYDYIKYPDEKLNVLTVGTHGDKLKDFIKEGKESIEKIEAKQRELLIMLNSVSDSCTYDENSPIYEIDGRKAHDKSGKSDKSGEPDDGVSSANIEKVSNSCTYDRDSPLYEIDDCKADDKSGESDDGVTTASIKDVSDHLKNQALQIDVPLRWHYFGVILRKKANESNGLLSRSDCEYYGKMLEMKVEEVHSALQFFHELGMLFYYKASPTNDIVFVKLDCLINIIRDVVIKVSESRHLPLSKLLDEEKDLRAGKLSVKILKSSDAFKVIAKQLFNDDYNICFKKLLALFQYLKIAAEVPGEGQFVMPALLPLKGVDTIELPHQMSQKSSTLLFYFKNAVPMGFFCAIVVHLLSVSWQLCIAEGYFSNHCTLQLPQENGRYLSYLKITLVEKLNWIEIQQTECKRTDQLKAKTELDKAIDSVMKALKLSEKISPAFYCPCPIEGEHVATVDVKESHNSSIECKAQRIGVELSADMYKDYFSWFFAEEDDPLLDKTPKIKDLLKLFESSAAHFKFIGIALEVQVNDLLPTPEATDNNLIQVFERWIDSNNKVTWRKVLKVCEEFPKKFGRAKAEVEKFLSSDEARDNY